ncbi:MAG: SpoIID/LytB domain-containing protein [Clostridiales bacterium]|nr:SpoIID/LytB domain-containing protein [Clostridiales bacterium]
MVTSRQMRRLFLSLSVILIIMTISITSEAKAASIPEYIKVGLRFKDTAATTYTLSSESGFVLGSVSDEGFKETLPLPAYNTLIACIEGNHVALRDTDGVLISLDIGRNGCLMPLDYKENGIITFEGKKYRGGIILNIESNNRIKAINYLAMDEYLYGVLHKEMSQSYPMEALKAQAVAARSFAVESIGRHYNDGFDVCTTTDCQVYGGYEDEYPRTNQAVDETSGLIIWANGQPAPVFYLKNSGGHTQSIEDVWTSSHLPHLVGKTDPYSPDYPWIATITFDSLEQKLLQAGYDPGSIESVQVGGRNSAGAVSELIIKGSKDTVILEKERIRTVLGPSLVRSRHFNIGEVYLGKNSVTFEVQMILSNGTKVKNAQDKINIISADGKIKSITSENLYITNGKQTAKAKTVAREAKFDDSIVARGKEVTFSGMGYGHGVGMAQDGAIEMAKQGFNFIDILKFYFTNIEVR